MITLIINFLETVRPMSPALIQKLHEIIKFAAFKKNEKLLIKGRVSSNVFFITRGLIRGYRTGKRGRETTAWFMKELDIAFSVHSFLTQQPGKETIESLEHTIAGYITFEELEMLYEEFPEFNAIGRLLVQRYYVLSEERAEDLRANNAREKYEVFKEKHTELEKRVPSKHIASYLGIREETLNKIKNGKY